MKTYKASKSPESATWLALDESERLALIEEYVEEFEGEIDNVNIHACAHMVVENQLALHVEDTVNAYSRLIRQGLNRHEVIHAIGAVIFEGIYTSLKEKQSINKYKSRLRKLTAKRWLKGKY